MKEIRGMIGDHKRDPIKLEPLAPAIGQSSLRIMTQKSIRGSLSQGDKNTRAHNLDLASKIRQAKIHFLRRRRTIAIGLAVPRSQFRILPK